MRKIEHVSVIFVNCVAVISKKRKLSRLPFEICKILSFPKIKKFRNFPPCFKSKLNSCHNRNLINVRKKNSSYAFLINNNLLCNNLQNVCTDTQQRSQCYRLNFLTDSIPLSVCCTKNTKKAYILKLKIILIETQTCCC